MMSLSIAVVTNERSPITHPGDVSKVASELKKRAKALKGSVYVKDQRGQTSDALNANVEPAHVDDASPPEPQKL